MVTNSTGLVLITGSSHGLLSFREIWSLQELYSIDMNESGAIRSLAFTEGKSGPSFCTALTRTSARNAGAYFLLLCSWSTRADQQYLLIGSEDGTFSIATDPEARWRSFTFALQKTPILGSGM